MGVPLGRGYPSKGNFTALGLLGGLPGPKGRGGAAGGVHRLADVDGLSRVVGRLASQAPRTTGGIQKAVTQALQAQEPTGV
ncbi:hypothetical protein ACFQ6V_27505 [Streptomyces roseifaciens]